MRFFLVAAFFLGTMWDAATTVFGTASIISGSSRIGLEGLDGTETISSVIFALIITAILVGFQSFARIGSDTPVWIISWALFLAALFYDIYTSYVGNVAMVIKGVPTGDQLILAVALTVFSSASPLILSSLFSRY